MVLELGRALVEQNVDAIVISLTGHTTYTVPEDLPVYFLYPLKKVPFYSRWKRATHASDLQELIAHIGHTRGPIDLVVSNLDYSHYILSACHLPNIVYVVHNALEQTMARAKRMGPVKWLRQRRLFRSLEGKSLVAVSDSLKAELQTTRLFNAESVRRIYNPFNIEQIRALAAQPNADIPSAPYLIHVGRFARQKRHDLLFSALKKSGDKRPLVCLGANEKGINRLARKLGVEDQVVVPGFQQNPYPWIKHADGLVLSSDYEGLSMVIVESLICGTPVAATDCPHGPAELLSKTLPENLVPAGEAQALGNVLGKLDGLLKIDNANGFFNQFDHREIARQYIALAKGQASIEE